MADYNSGVADAAPHRPTWTAAKTAINLADPTGDHIVSPSLTEEQRLELIHRLAQAHRALLALTERESAVVRRRYGFHTGKPMDFTLIADDLDVSYNSVQKTHTRAMMKMRKVLGVKRKKLKR